MSTIQIIDQNKTFNQSILPFVDQASRSTGGLKAIGLDFHVVSVFGSQSSGKSTLLNELFRTKFDVMAELSRQQTTKGIWMGHALSVASTREQPQASHILVMDVEGSDGRERGEDQDFERKAALFALLTSEILIVNIWENQVGLYQGANMGLLKTVFEVNLSLTSSTRHKTLLLFVVRDHVGHTPLDNLSATLLADLNAIWAQLNKPNGVDIALSELFDVKFHALAHKVLQPEEFVSQVRLLGDRMLDTGPQGLFQPEYRHNLPLDGWTMYAEQCWEQIETNKDLDLPTQQTLVARFKCEEIAAEAFAQFQKEFHTEFPQEGSAKAAAVVDQTGPALGAALQGLRERALAQYDALASRYHADVYTEKQVDLAGKVDAKLQGVYEVFVTAARHKALHAFTKQLEERGKASFGEACERARSTAIAEFEDAAMAASLEGTFSYGAQAQELELGLEELVAAARLKEIDSLVSQSVKRVTSQLKENVTDLLSQPEVAVWDSVLAEYQTAVGKILSKFKTAEGYDFGVGSTNAEALVERLRRAAWLALNTIIRDFVTEDNLVVVVRDIFEEAFRYDAEGLPRLWSNTKEIDEAYRRARDRALAGLPFLTTIRHANGSEVVAEWEDEDVSEFALLLSSKQVEAIKTKFKRQSDAIFFEAQRSVAQASTQIPYYIYLVIMALGWNEFMAVIRNPFFFIWLVTFGAAAFTVHYLGLTRPVLAVVNTTIAKTMEVGKAKLKEVLQDPPARVEEIELTEVKKRS